MPINIEYNPEEKHIEVILSGNADIKSLTTIMVEMLTEVPKYKKDLLLISGCDLIKEASNFQISKVLNYKFPLTNIPDTATKKVALVSCKGKAADMLFLTETLSTLKKDAKFFANKEDALAWLLV